MRFQQRIILYVVIWLMLTATAVSLRAAVVNPFVTDSFSVMAGYLCLVGLLLAISGVYESRRSILRSGWRGRGVFGYLRGWLKTFAVELAVDTPTVNRNAERELFVFHRVAAALFVLTGVVMVVLLGACTTNGPTETEALRSVADFTAPVTMPPAGFAEVMQVWRWALPRTPRPLLITALGDVFLEGDSGEVLFLDTESGKVETVASSRNQWFSMLTDAEKVEAWFRPSFVRKLEAEGKPLQREEVYSPIVPLILNGQRTVQNYTPSPWDAHLNAMGQIHRQVKDLPSGTPMTRIHVDPW